MSLANLKKRGPLVNRSVISVDEFIEQAEVYASGQSKIVPLHANMAPHPEVKENTLKRATFTLGETAIEQLNNLSEHTGIAKSRLLRIWLDQESAISSSLKYISSTVK